MGKQRPWLAAAMAAVGLVELCRDDVQPWMYTWGATREEVDAVLPGDELVVPDMLRTTRAVTIHAPVAEVWPWLAQIGEDRGGFYSYSLLERAGGAHIHNADAVQPRWQRLHVGDTIWLARRYGDAARQVVAAVEPNSHLVLMSPDDFARVQRGEKAWGAWAFCLAHGPDGTRLVVRGSGGPVGHALFDLPHFMMEQKMLRGIRDRVEREHRDAAEVVSLPNRQAASPPSDASMQRIHGAATNQTRSP